MSFKTKKIPEHLIIRPSTWDRPKKRGRWLFWLIGPLVCFGLVVFAVQSMADETEQAGSGQLIFHHQSAANGTNRNTSPALLVSSSLAIEISGIMAHITLIQTFSNQTDFWQEGTYIFPLPETAAVNFMQMKIGDRLIKAIVKEKEEARNIYKKARAQGQKATLIEQSRPNLFTQKISNIAPGETIIIELHLIQLVDYNSGSFTLRFPTTFTPRYKPSLQKSLEDQVTRNSGWNFSNEKQIAQNAMMLNPKLKQPNHLQNPVDISVNLNSGLALSQITSPYHNIRIKRQGTRHEISLSNGPTSMDRDFMLEWEPTKSHLPQAAIFRERLGDEDYVLLMVLPPNHQANQQNLEKQSHLPKEMIFVIDTSGSMGGESIRQAKASLKDAIQRLRPEDQFNVIEFNSLYSQIFYGSQPASLHNKQLAISWIGNLTAGGGTEMLPALRAALRPTLSENLLKQIIFITDGAVGNETELFALIHKNLKQSKLFTVGIGSAPNSFFMRKAAQFGAGTFTHIGDKSEIKPKMNTLFTKLENPVVREIFVTWNNSTESYPKQIPSLYANEPLLIVAKTKDLGKTVKIQGTTASHSWSQKLQLNTGASQSGLGTLWARAKIEALEDEKIAGRSQEEVKKEVIDIALRHHLVSQYTSLIAVEEKTSKPHHSKSLQSQIANLNPKGQSITQLHYPRTATSGEFTLWLGSLSLMLYLFFTVGITFRKTYRKPK